MVKCQNKGYGEVSGFQIVYEEVMGECLRVKFQYKKQMAVTKQH